MNVSIIGTTGYGGAELLRILHSHPVYNIQSIHSTREELPISEEYPHLTDILDHRLEKIDPDKIAEHSELVFLATPSGVSGKLTEAFADSDIQIVDLSGDLRLKQSGVYKKWYGHNAVDPKIINEAVYGLSEWNSQDVARARILSNPGCYPTAALLGLAPVAMNKLIDPAMIIIDAKSGASGAGRAASKGSNFSEVNENIKIYKVNQHQHIPEIEQQLNVWNEAIGNITFSTHLLPITRGIMATMYVKLLQPVSTEEITDLYREMYKNHPFVRIRPVGTYPSIKEVAGSNYCDIGLNSDERTGRLTIVSVIDNLVKGAAGQAVQNANIMNGLDEKAGLEFVPFYP
ncbi:N-acetyl-gamma-glutamyl-phosphate reductase [Bacillus canaveralius]|uniref:N-acetyl-gamma-glutamyl-phosphate reductase n=1 Tax=Bacillus canaveralius TaxID=1403243 RepID=A0A2N5GKE9_9BACI|nr:N-acetyl-gamma-glutamyl-phosphate reductase [Bacillus canaveralius]PLR82003.1 N-acetyl-gamma-glutamyl-phosphate reductase [Bacillus canaveralius]PLR99389.1 N-acetyl-gamma-glutamyl-phosphate reductase [Bacillus canaveralius]